jgi:hydrogenase maturation protease
VSEARSFLVAGIGNIFLGDDGFGVEVVRRLAARPLPEGVRVADYGIRGVHLAFDLLEHPDDTTILVDITPRGGAPGTVYLIEPDLEALADAGDAGDGSGVADAHSMTPDAVFRLLRSLGGTPRRVWIVGCEPLSTEEEMGLSHPVEQAVDEAVGLILAVLSRESRGAPEDLKEASGETAGAGERPAGILQDELREEPA